MTENVAAHSHPGKGGEKEALPCAYTRLRARLRRITGKKRLKNCGVLKCRQDFGVRVAGEGDGRTARAVGVMTCNSVHICPVCSRRIRARRMVQLSRALRGGLEAHPQAFWVMLSVTFRHFKGLRLGWLRDCLMRAWRMTRQQRQVRKLFDSHVLASARAIEVTFGSSGWHPHVHVCLLTTAWSPRDKRVLLETYLRSFAACACKKITGTLYKKKRATKEKPAHTVVTHGVVAWDVESYRKWLAYFTEYKGNAIRWSRCQACKGAGCTSCHGSGEARLYRGDGGGKLEEYLTDIGLELSLGATKSTHAEASLTPWQIAERAVGGSEVDRERWDEYERAMHGTRCIELDERAAALAVEEEKRYPATDAELLKGGAVGEVSFEGAELVGKTSVYVDLDPEFLRIVRDYERVHVHATWMWLEAARTSPAPLTAASIRDAVDRCIYGMVCALRDLGVAGYARPKAVVAFGT